MHRYYLHKFRAQRHNNPQGTLRYLSKAMTHAKGYCGHIWTYMDTSASICKFPAAIHLRILEESWGISGADEGILKRKKHVADQHILSRCACWSHQTKHSKSTVTMRVLANQFRVDCSAVSQEYESRGLIVPGKVEGTISQVWNCQTSVMMITSYRRIPFFFNFYPATITHSCNNLKVPKLSLLLLKWPVKGKPWNLWSNPDVCFAKEIANLRCSKTVWNLKSKVQSESLSNETWSTKTCIYTSAYIPLA